MTKATKTLRLELKKTTLKNRQLEGYGSKFGNVDAYGDIVQPGAFADSLARHKANDSMPALLWMHDPRNVAGKWDDMSEDDEGLQVRGTLAKTPLGDEVHELIKMEAVKGLSIGYRVEIGEWKKMGDDYAYLIHKADLWEVSVVTFAANPLAQITGVKSRTAAGGVYVPTRREFEDELREKLGDSKSAVKQISHKVYGDGMSSDDDDTSDSRRDADQAAIKSAMEALALCAAASKL